MHYELVNKAGLVMSCPTIMPLEIGEGVRLRCYDECDWNTRASSRLRGSIFYDHLCFEENNCNVSIDSKDDLYNKGKYCYKFSVVGTNLEKIKGEIKFVEKLLGVKNARIINCKFGFKLYRCGRKYTVIYDN